MKEGKKIVESQEVTDEYFQTLRDIGTVLYYLTDEEGNLSLDRLQEYLERIDMSYLEILEDSLDELVRGLKAHVLHIVEVG